jgi:predicted nucleotidyltransferase
MKPAFWGKNGMTDVVSRQVDEDIQTWLDLAVARLRQAIAPERIILFGSWARGTATRRSDLALSIVWDCDLPPLDRIGQVLSLLSDSPHAVDVIVYTPNKLRRCQERRFIRQLLAAGLVLYERGKAAAGS